MLSNKKIIKYSVCLSNNNYFNMLGDLLLAKRYLYRYFGYSISFTVETNIVTKKKKIVLLKSPFVHKKAQEQFFILTYKKKINIFFPFVKKIIFQFYWILSFLKKLFKKMTTSFTSISYIAS